MKVYKFLLIAATVTVLQGCVAAAVVGVAGGISAANDNRSLGNQIDDSKIEFSAHKKLTNEEGLDDNTNIQVISVNAKVLVVGQAPNTYLRDLVIKTIKGVLCIQMVFFSFFSTTFCI